MKKQILAAAMAVVVALSAPMTVSAAWKRTGSGNWQWTENGRVKTGWVQTGGKWYYMDSNGIMKTGWVKVGGKWYYMDSTGAMKTGWAKVGNKWYYLDASGAMKTGWLQLGQKWYYLDASGAMVTGKNRIDGKDYEFNASGEWTGSGSSQSGQNTSNDGTSGAKGAFLIDPVHCERGGSFNVRFEGAEVVEWKSCCEQVLITDTSCILDTYICDFYVLSTATTTPTKHHYIECTDSKGYKYLCQIVVF